VRAHLLDLNLLVALAWPNHVHHRLAHEWFSESKVAGWATCPLTQCGFVRLSSNPAIVDDAVSPRDAIELLRRITALEHHQFWPDAVGVCGSECDAFRRLVGHRQVTDAYLVCLAAHNGGKLATLDGRIASLFENKEAIADAVTFISS